MIINDLFTNKNPSVAEDIGDLGYNVVRYYEKTQEVKKLTNWLEKEAGLPRNSPLYFDDVDLVYGNKTIVPGALINPKLTFNDLLTAVVQASKQGMSEATGDEKFDTMMGQIQREPKYPDSQMPPTDVKDLYQWAVKNNKPYHKIFAEWANREGYKSVAPALQRAGDLDTEALDYWTPRVWEIYWGEVRGIDSEMPPEWAKKRIPDELRDYLDTVFDAYDRIVFDWPTEYRQIGQQGMAEGQTDYQKRRQRERDVDAGKPVKPEPKNPQNDYFARRKKEKEQGMAEGKADYNFDIEDLKRLEQIRDLATLKAQAFELISRPSARPMKPEKVEWFRNALERMNTPLKVIKLMYDLLLSGEGQAVVGTRSSMNPNMYRKRFGEQGVAENQDWMKDLAARAAAKSKPGTPYVPPKQDAEKQRRDLADKYPNIDELVRQAELNRDPNYDRAEGPAYYAGRDAEHNYHRLKQIQRMIRGAELDEMTFGGVGQTTDSATGDVTTNFSQGPFSVSQTKTPGGYTKQTDQQVNLGTATLGARTVGPNIGAGQLAGTTTKTATNNMTGQAKQQVKGVGFGGATGANVGKNYVGATDDELARLAADSFMGTNESVERIKHLAGIRPTR